MITRVNSAIFNSVIEARSFIHCVSNYSFERASITLAFSTLKMTTLKFR